MRYHYWDQVQPPFAKPPLPCLVLYSPARVCPIERKTSCYWAPWRSARSHGPKLSQSVSAVHKLPPGSEELRPNRGRDPAPARKVFRPLGSVSARRAKCPGGYTQKRTVGRFRLTS